MLLHAVRKIERVVHLEPLEHIPAAVEQDLPAMVGHDVSCMDRPGWIKLPRKAYTHANAGIRDLL
jgi:hypothetical protein